MRMDELHGHFLNAVKDRIPQKTKLAGALADLLSIEKEAVYRRLRGEVYFSFAEIAMISKELDISIDQIIRTGASFGRIYEMFMIEYANLVESNYLTMEDYRDKLSLSRIDPNSEIAESSNVLPISLYGKFELLSKYYLFKWRYQFNDTGQQLLFSDIEIPERLLNIYHSYFTESKYIANSIYVWDNEIFQFLVNDIKFFTSINLINKTEVKELKDTLFQFIDYVESLIVNGAFEETGNKILFYISDVNIDTGYSYLKVQNYQMSLIRVFILNSVISYDHIAFDKTKNWIQSQKRLSTLISETGEMQRILFLKKQREIIDSL